MSISKDKAITRKIIREMDDLTQIFKQGYEVFCDSVILQKASAMTLINIGELSSRYSEQFKEDHSEIPWKAIKGLRNIAAHDYDRLDEKIVWKTICEDIPKMRNELEKETQKPLAQWKQEVQQGKTESAGKEEPGKAFPER